MEALPPASLASVSGALATAPGVALALPPLVAAAGAAAARHTLEFFTAHIPNPNTREAYGRAVWRFSAWCGARGLELEAITPPSVAAYLEELGAALSVPSVKQHLSALRHWLDFLTARGVLRQNPAASVRGPRHVVHEGKTPVLERSEARKLLESVAGDDVPSRRDRALLAVMLFGFVRVGAAVRMRVRDFEHQGAEASLLIREKGGKQRSIPAHHRVTEYLRAYIEAAELEPESRAPLFQRAPGRSGKLNGKALDRSEVWAMVKRRCRAAGLPPNICNHSFRATGITIHQENGGKLEDAAKLAGHSSTRTTQLYNRKNRKIARAEVERVQL